MAQWNCFKDPAGYYNCPGPPPRPYIDYDGGNGPACWRPGCVVPPEDPAGGIPQVSQSPYSLSPAGYPNSIQPTAGSPLNPLGAYVSNAPTFNPALNAAIATASSFVGTPSSGPYSSVSPHTVVPAPGAAPASSSMGLWLALAAAAGGAYLLMRKR